jgi:hypothetical protein
LLGFKFIVAVLHFPFEQRLVLIMPGISSAIHIIGNLLKRLTKELILPMMLVNNSH